MTAPTRLDFPLAKAQYLLNRASQPGVGGDKQKFWRQIMGFESPEVLREVILAQLSLEHLQLVGQNDYGDRYQAVILVTGISGVSWQIRTIWIVCFGEDVARFVTAFPERYGRLQ